MDVDVDVDVVVAVDVVVDVPRTRTSWSASRRFEPHHATLLEGRSVAAPYGERARPGRRPHASVSISVPVSSSATRITLVDAMIWFAASF